MSQRHIKRWVDAGLLSSTQGEDILAFEAARHRPWLQWAVLGIGGLAIFLGITALVASNWFNTPAGMKLGTHLAFNIAAGWGVIWAWRSAKPLWLDLAVFLFAGLLLTAIALTGQVFQLSSPLWRPLAFWTVIATPVLMIAGQGRLPALAWAAGFVGATFSYLFSLSSSETAHTVLMALPGAAAAALIAIGFLGYARSMRTNYWRTLSDCGFALTVVLASYAAAVVWGYEPLTEQRDYAAAFWSAAPILLVAMAFAAGCVWRQGPADRPKVWLLAVAFAVAALPAALPLGGVMGKAAAAILFMAFWAGIAWTCIKSNRPELARVAVGVIAVRLITIYFEVFGSLAMTGIGLIVSGVTIIVVATVTLKLMKRLPSAKARP
jgi:hypothetical protein